ncbi:hypothetical protein GCM10027188_16910 [Lysobacter humi (ex Lee et al. 2017)]
MQRPREWVRSTSDESTSRKGNLTPFPHFPGATDSLRGAAYRALLSEALAEHDVAAVRAYPQQQRAYGRDGFRAMVEAKTRRSASVRPAHRPARVFPTMG